MSVVPGDVSWRRLTESFLSRLLQRTRVAMVARGRQLVAGADCVHVQLLFSPASRCSVGTQAMSRSAALFYKCADARFATINKRIVHNMISGSPLILGFRTRV